MKQITAKASRDDPPRWAQLQRALIDAMNDSVDPVLERYLHPDGRFLWPQDEDTFHSVDGLDDAYESFHSWPLFYLAGGHERFLSLSHREYNVITEQFSHYPTGHGHPMVVKEYEQGYDWMHQGEGYQFFYLLNLADPDSAQCRDRSVRYAGFYLNEDPEVAPNYDPQHRLLRCCYLGSMGPAHRNFTGAPWGYAEWKLTYGLPFHDLEGITTIEDMKDEYKALKMGAAMKERMAYGDTAVNLFATSMVMNAYLHTGEGKYKDWIVEYSEAWRERAAAHGGIMPDNVGPSGVVGECFGGRWYGGYYGWTWPHGLPFIMEAVTTAAQNCSLVKGAPDMDWPRALLAAVMDMGIVQNDTLHVPQKYADPGSIQEYKALERCLTDDEARKTTLRSDFSVLLARDGWFEFQPLPASYSAHILQFTRAPRDMQVAASLRDHMTESHRKIRHFYAKDQGGHDEAWLNYLDGSYPSYPEEILEHNLFQVSDRLRMMREDVENPADYNNAYLQRRNPITCEGLVQLTMGGPLPLYNGGLLQVAIRHFDAAGRRPGLPKDTAALVRRVGSESIEFAVVNTSRTETRELVVQAGTYGEHDFTRLRYSQPGSANVSVRVDDRHLGITLPPGAILELTAEVARNKNVPSYRLPWS